MNSRAVGYALIALTLVSVGISGKASYDRAQDQDNLEEAQVQLAEAVRCINGFLAENKRVSTVRSAATIAKDDVETAKDDATAKLIDGITDLSLAPSKDPIASGKRYQALLSDYKAATVENRKAAEQLKSERAKNPLPDLPASCQEIPDPEKLKAK